MGILSGYAQDSERTMDDFKEFERCLAEALTHLYDPTYQPPELIWQATGCKPQQGVKEVQAALIRAIEDLEPAPDVPKTARIRRLYELLACRYIQELTQAETAFQLGITDRHVRREQQEAIGVLARHVWEQPGGQVEGEGVATPAWRSQVKQELLSLQQSTPDAVADVGQTVNGIVKVGQALTEKRGIALNVGAIRPNLAVVIHPSALRQVLITAIDKLAQQMSAGEITLEVERAEEHVKITVAGCPVLADSPPHSDLIEEIMATQGGLFEIRLTDHRLVFEVRLLPTDREVTVLVVDDNLDLVNFYRNYTTDTRYHIVHLSEGKRLFETVAGLRPDIIVLDVMLPDIDGWELLTYLHEHPDTRAIPVIVCSVVKREELASALGAALYLPKPVRRQQFIQALDQVLVQVQARASRTEASNAITG
jgi:CheY-like chemotaxis protein